MSDNERDPHLSVLFSQSEEALPDESFSLSVDTRIEKEVVALAFLKLTIGAGALVLVILMALTLSLFVHPLNSWSITPLFTLDNALMHQVLGPAFSPAALIALTLGLGLLFKNRILRQ